MGGTEVTGCPVAHRRFLWHDLLFRTRSDPSATLDVIVQFKAPLTKDDLKQLGPNGPMKKMFDGIHAVLMPLPVSTLASVANNPNVAFLSPDRTVRGAVDLTAAAVKAGTAVVMAWTTRASASPFWTAASPCAPI
jgi:hypothetical protein